MARGNVPHTKVHYQGKDEDFIVFVEAPEAVYGWRKDKSIPLAQVVSGWKIFITHKQGAQGILDGAPNSVLENEFGTHNEEDVVRQILEKGTMQETENPERQAHTNWTRGPMVPH